jgi:hypothetical protein
LTTLDWDGINSGKSSAKLAKLAKCADPALLCGAETGTSEKTRSADFPELEKVEQAFIRILGLKPLYFRPPYGSINDQVLQVLGQRGYKSKS